jgi:hypothetical protein
LQLAHGHRVTEKCHFSTLNVGLAGTGNRTQATCLAGSDAQPSTTPYKMCFEGFFFLRCYISGMSKKNVREYIKHQISISNYLKMYLCIKITT